MHSTHAADLIRKYNLSSGMLAAIHSGANGAILNCAAVTESALIRRGIMHPTQSNLTEMGRDILAALLAPQDVVAAPAPKVLEGFVVTHAGTTKGSLPKHSTDGDTRAAIAALSAGSGLKLAELADHFEPDEGEEVQGFMIEPRGNGRVAVYWLFGGSIRERNGEPFRVELEIAADKLRAAGWRIERKSLFCVFAWRPVEEFITETAVQIEAEAVARLPKITAGDLVEAETVSTMPRAIRVRVDREPWQNSGKFGTVLCDAKGAVVVKTASIRVIDETPAGEDEPIVDEPLARWAVAIGPDERLWIGFHERDRAIRCAAGYGLGDDAIRDRHATQPELLHEEINYGIQYRVGNGPWRSHITTSAIRDEAEADDYIGDLQALAGPDTELRAVEVRTTHTALPQPGEPKPCDIERGPMAARKIRAGDRVYHGGLVRLVWKVEYQRTTHSLRVHTVPPAEENAAYFAFTFTPSEMTDLVSRGPAVDVTGRPVDTTR